MVWVWPGAGCGAGPVRERGRGLALLPILARTDGYCIPGKEVESGEASQSHADSSSPGRFSPPAPGSQTPARGKLLTAPPRSTGERI